MTKAKRYEGEQARSDMWHRASRDKAWDVKRQRAHEVESIVHGKYNLYVEPRYNAETCSYDMVIEVGAFCKKLYPSMRPWPEEIIMEHVEDFRVFPSDHLKTKLLLIAG